ncbi:hypothetical protein OEZ85_013579 [Tetradesmus obliquus]|uniref:Uncharacterized protein n=1 Tax=Tetradesmus obliquus TaxID=3088 RepID=A0ABY8URB2_TETOB|nr:hypothetical protein OEZ85_013579 [Tetradesmus obliquus]
MPLLLLALELLLAAAWPTAAAAAAPTVEVRLVFDGLGQTIFDSNDEWASAAAITDKLTASAEPPGYVFYSNLQRRGVPYEPTVFVDNTLLLQGSPALSSRSTALNPTTPADATSAHLITQGPESNNNMIGPLPRWIFIPIVILASLLALLALVGFGVLMWRGARAFKMCYNEEVKGRGQQQQQQQQGQFIVGGGSGAAAAADGLIEQPGGGYLPTQGALEKLNATFPNKTSSLPRGPDSWTYGHLRGVAVLAAAAPAGVS